MNATLNKALQGHNTVTEDDLRFYVYLTDGQVCEVWPATGFEVTQDEVIAVLGGIPVARFPRQQVFWATHRPAAAPVLF